jgi:hypothetical protein
MKLNWTDNATNEIGYAVYRSTDGLNYTFVTQLPPNTASLTQSGLIPAATYYWTVQPVSEGALGTALSGSQATSTSGAIVAAGNGNWTSTTPNAPWPGGVVPTASDAVVVPDGRTVTVNANAACLSLTIGGGTSGIVRFAASAAETLAVGSSVLISPAGTLSSALTGTQLGHRLAVGGDLTNNGTLDLSTNSGSAGAQLMFNGSAAASFTGSGATTDVLTILVDKSAAPTATVLIAPQNLTVQGVTSNAAAFLTATNGTARIGGTYTMSSVLTVQTSIPATGGLWLDNPNFTVPARAGNFTQSGLLRVSAGTFNVGTALDNSLNLQVGSTTIVEGGAINVTGRFGVSAAASTITYTQTGGTVTASTVGNTSTTLASFDLGTAASAAATISGGTIVLQVQSSAASGPRDFRNQAGVLNMTGGRLQLGNASTPAAQTYFLRGTSPGLDITNTPAGHTARLGAAVTAVGPTDIRSGATLLITGFRFMQSEGNLANEGTLTVSSGELFFKGTTTPQTYSGAGVVTAPIAGQGLTVDNPAGFTIDSGVPQGIVALQATLIRGVFHNAQLLTLGDSTHVGVTQIGQTNLTDPAGSYDTYPVKGSGAPGFGVVYLGQNSTILTGFEIPANDTLSTLTMNSSSPVQINTGDLYVTTTFTLTTGVLRSMPGNRIILTRTANRPAGTATSYVEGPLGIEVSSGSATTATFAVGAEGAFRSLVLGNVITGGVPRTFFTELIPGATGGTPLAPLTALAYRRYWHMSGGENLNTSATAKLAFGADDNGGALANLRVAEATGSASGGYTNRGGVTTGDQSGGTVTSNVALAVAPDIYFDVGSVVTLSKTWDGGAATTNWGDANNWSPDGVPLASQDVSLSAVSPITINVNGAFAANALTVDANVTLNMGTGSLAVAAGYVQKGSTVNLNTGSLAVTGNSRLTAGSLDVASGTFSTTGADSLLGTTVTVASGGTMSMNSHLYLAGGLLSMGAGTVDLKGHWSAWGDSSFPAPARWSFRVPRASRSAAGSTRT